HPLVAQEVCAWMVLRIRRRNALQVLALHLVTLLAQRVDDGDELLARSVGRDRLAEALELDVVDHVAPAGGDEAFGVEGDVTAALEVGINVQLVGRLVGRESDVAVGPRHPARRTELRLEVGQESEHRRLDVVLVLAAVGLEPRLVVVCAQTEEEAFEVALPAAELTRHGARLSLAALSGAAAPTYIYKERRCKARATGFSPP